MTPDLASAARRGGRGADHQFGLEQEPAGLRPRIVDAFEQELGGFPAHLILEILDRRQGRIPERSLLPVSYTHLDVYKRQTLDNIFAEDNPGVAVSGLTETSVSPKLGGIWRFNDEWSVLGNYAHGFRSPPYGDVNVGFTNLQGGYTVIANPDLKPETSNGFELGVRFVNAAFYAGLTGYYND